MSAVIRDVGSPDQRKTLRALKLGQMIDTLPDRLVLARQPKTAHADFLDLVLPDEVSRREANSAALRAKAAALDAVSPRLAGARSPPPSGTPAHGLQCGERSRSCSITAA